MNKHTLESFEDIDASIFSGDILHDEVAVDEIETYINRWLRAIDAIEQDESTIPEDVKSIVKDANAYFDHYADGNLWYNTSRGFSFPIPIEDTKGGVFSKIHTAINLMRWIRKHLETLKKADNS